MISIAIMNIKGGVGKTSSAVNLAACFSLFHKKRVLLIDCDAQVNATEYLLVNQAGEPDGTIADALHKTPANKVAYTVSFRAIKNKAFHISMIPGDRDIESVSIKDINVLREKLQAVRKDYDICIFDCPPHASDLAVAAICASNYIIVPAQADTDSLGGYSRLIDIVNTIRTGTDNTTLDILGVFFNNVSPRESLNKLVTETIREGFGDTIFSSVIRRYSLVGKARYLGYPVCCLSGSDNITEDYRSLSKEILRRIKKRGISI